MVPGGGRGSRWREGPARPLPASPQRMKAHRSKHRHREGVLEEEDSSRGDKYPAGYISAGGGGKKIPQDEVKNPEETRPKSPDGHEAHGEWRLPRQPRTPEEARKDPTTPKSRSGGQGQVQGVGAPAGKMGVYRAHAIPPLHNASPRPRRPRHQERMAQPGWVHGAEGEGGKKRKISRGGSRRPLDVESKNARERSLKDLQESQELQRSQNQAVAENSLEYSLPSVTLC